MTRTPRVSVVVCTRARPARLRRLLAGLAAQTLGPEDFELVIVDDGSEPPVADSVSGPLRAAGVRVELRRHPTPRGPGAARNSGWLRAQAPWVAFIDDDCVPVPGWLSAGLRNADSADVIQGQTLPDPAEADSEGLLTRTVSVREAGPRFETCNIFYRREILAALGGFDEGYGTTPGGEDTDLGWRALAAGARPAFEADALVHHAVEHLGVRGQLRVASRWSETIRIFSEHPQTRTMLYRGRFWNVWHYLMWRSALALLTPAWLRRLVLARHLFELRRRARDAGAGAWGVPFLLLYDAVECWSVARGALRHHTLVL